MNTSTPTRRYAERTKVTEQSSRAHIEAELARHQCERVAVMTEATGVCFAWTKGTRSYRMGIMLPVGDAQERRRRLRTLHLYLKARLNAVEDGVVAFEDEFLREVVLIDGRTMGEHAREQFAAIEAAGQMPTRLMLPGAGGGA